MSNFKTLSKELSNRIESERANGTYLKLAFDESLAIRRNDLEKDTANILRTPFMRDIDKIMHCPYYNRYADKTQVFSFYKNDDITRRALHVQLVSRIARTIGKALNLNLDLIEAIALGHDIGHTPFGHTGEHHLDEIYREHTGRRFSHNIQSVRVLDKIYPLNISLQTLSGIAAHDGEYELAEYRPRPLDSFEEFDRQIEECYINKAAVKKLAPSSLEGCVMRISDIIAYLGKDRLDASLAKLVGYDDFTPTVIGSSNSEIINNMIVNIIENSYGKPYITMDSDHFEALRTAKAENYKLIYDSTDNRKKTNEMVKPMMADIYDKLLEDLTTGRKVSPIFTHHIAYINRSHHTRFVPYEDDEPNQIVVDYIASMTDDYFIDLHAFLFPKSPYKIEYKGYFQ